MEIEWPAERSGHISVAIGKFILIWGGYAYPQNAEEGLDIYLPPKEVWLWNSDTFKWIRQITAGDHPPGLSGAQAVYLEKESGVYVICGFKGNDHNNQVHRLDTDAWSWTHIAFDNGQSQPSPRDKFGAWEYENSIYIFGGYGPDISHYLHDGGTYFTDFFSLMPQLKGWNNQLLIFDTQSRTWSNPKCSGNVPSPRAAHGAVRIRHEAFVFGGRHDALRLNDLYSLNLLSFQWTEIVIAGDVPVGRSWHSLTPVSDNRICLFGGYTTDCKTLDDLWILDTVSFRWREVHVNRSMPRLWHTASKSSDGQVIVFGGCSNDILSDIPTVHRCDLLVLHVLPQSLLNLCLDAVYSYKHLLEDQWSELPHKLTALLQARHDIPHFFKLC